MALHQRPRLEKGLPTEMQIEIAVRKSSLIQVTECSAGNAMDEMRRSKGIDLGAACSL